MIPRPIRVVREAAVRAPPRGLPGPLPAGERILWQGSPGWWGLARRGLHVRKVAAYLTILELVTVLHAMRVGGSAWESAALLATLGAVAIGMLCAFAFGTARSAIYTVTDRRIVLRSGMALTASINLPFRFIEGASVKLYRDGSGDIPLALEGRTRIGIVQLWPHVRPWRFRSVEPMLRAVPDAARVARLLSEALAASAAQPVPAAIAEPAPTASQGGRRPAGVPAFAPGLGARGA